MSIVRTNVLSNSRISLHPLPILNIGENLARIALQSGDNHARVYGGLLGTQEGNHVEIMNTFEIVVKPNQDGELTVDHSYFTLRRDQYKQVFPTFDFLGWYGIGPEPTKTDVAIHKQLFIYNEAPLFLQMSSTKGGNAKDLPLIIYESGVELVNNEQEVFFVKAGFEIETGEAERVAVDHVANVSTSTAQGSYSNIIANLTTQRNAIKMLSDRVSVIVQYLAGLKAGKVARDEETLRQISALMSSLPTSETKQFKTEFLADYNDVLLSSYLASLTKQLHSANQLLDRQSYIAPQSSDRRARQPSRIGFPTDF